MFEDFETITVDMGDTVLCDFCNKDFTDSNVTGGFLFQAKAVCPDCSEHFLANVKKYNETKYIRGYCPEGMSFSNWIRTFR